MEPKALSPLKERELIGGFVLLPFYLIVTSLLVSVIVILPDALRGKPLDVNAYLAPINLWSSLINLAAVLAVFGRFLWRQLGSFEGSFGRIVGTIAVGYAILFGGSMIASLLASAAQALGLDYHNANQETVEQLAGSSTIVAAVLATLCAPIGEECLFRGLIFGQIYPKSRFWAYAVSMAAFSAAHIFQGAIMGDSAVTVLLNFATYLPFGFALGWVYERCRSIWAAIALHFLNNAVALAMLLLPQLS